MDKRVSNLINTSVEDMSSSLKLYSYLNVSDIETVLRGYAICKRRGEKTKALILKQKLKQMERARQFTLHLSQASKPLEE